MPFSLRPYRRFLMQCSVTYNSGPFLKLLAYFLGLGSLITLMVLGNGAVYAEWVAVISSESSGGYTVYVDPNTIRHEEDGGGDVGIIRLQNKRNQRRLLVFVYQEAKRISLRRRTSSDPCGHALLWQYGKRYGGV